MAKKFTCKNCGAELYFDPKRGKLHCDYCDTDYDPEEYNFIPEEGDADRMIPQPDVAAEQTASASDEQATDDSLSNEDLVVYQCPNCGAEVITSKKTAATTCVYCNHAITLEGNVAGEFRPDYVLPFQIDRSRVEDAYRKLCRKSWLTPRLFLQDSTIEKIKGLYVPYWLYSFQGQVDLRLKTENTRIFRSGDNEITEVATYEINESGSAEFSKVPADALTELDNILMDSVQPFDFSKLVPFNPSYLAGFYTQRWDDPSKENEIRAKEPAKQTLRAEARRNVGMYTTEIVTGEQYRWSDIKTEYAMLPVWMMYTEYRGKKYIFGMNGQNGKIVGELPKDYGRLVGAAAFVFVISQIVMMILRIAGVLL